MYVFAILILVDFPSSEYTSLFIYSAVCIEASKRAPRNEALEATYRTVL
jgi:hypothetical protein